jgi:ribosomal protein S18 acetylase RimI-like enzyme
MTRAEFDAWAPHSVSNFADQQVSAGLMSPPEATALAERAFAELLPQGLETPLHHFWTVRETGGPDRAAGHLWVRVQPLDDEVEAYVYDVELVPDARGRGLGRATVLAAEAEARDLGASVLRLNVFGHNPAAVRLYDRLGLIVESAVLQHRLEVLPPTSGPGVELREVPPGHRSDFPDAARDDLVWTAHVAGERVGLVRLAVQQRSDGRHALCRDLEVAEGHRGHGYATAMGLAALRGVRDRGVKTVSAEVAGPGWAARRLCDRLGFGLTAQTMAKPLASR